MEQLKPTGRFGIVLPLLATLAAMAAFQVGAAFSKQLFPAVGAQGAAALRVVLAALLLVAFTRPWRNWPRKVSIVPVLGLGVSIAVAITSFFMALERLPLGVAIPLQFLGPLAVAIFGSRKATDLIWAALAAAGVWLLCGAGQGGVAYDWTGIACAMAAAVGWAGYILFGRVASASFGRSTGAVALSVAAVLVLPVGVAHAGAALLDPALLPVALLIAVLSSIIPFSLELYAMPRMPARTFATFTSLEPAFAVVSGLVLLHERLAWTQMAGVGVVIAAAAGAAWSSAAKTA